LSDCLKEGKHNYEYSIFEKKFICTKCKAQIDFIEDPDEFINISKQILLYCKNMINICDIGDAIIPIVHLTTNLMILYGKITEKSVKIEKRVNIKIEKG
jgi:hypothetical protein